MSDAISISKRRYRRRVVASGAFVFVLTFAIGAAIVIPNVEQRLEERVTETLADAGVVGVDVSFSGQDATLRCDRAVADAVGVRSLTNEVDGVRAVKLDASCLESVGRDEPSAIGVDGGSQDRPESTAGPAPSESAPEEPRATDTRGPASTLATPSIDDDSTATTVSAVPEPLQVVRTGDTISLLGVVASADQRRVLDVASSLVESVVVVDDLRIDSSAASSDEDVELLGRAVGALNALLDGRAVLDDGSVSVDGAAPDEFVVAFLEQFGDDNGISVDVTVPSQ